MRYNLFKQIFNESIFEKSKADLLEKIASSPSRYIGLFRPTKPKAKILQNLLQSHEIRFGDAFERVIEEYLRLKGCEILPKRFTNREGDVLNIDQCFRKDRKIYFIDPDLVKNKNFYVTELEKMTKDYNVETQIFYGKTLFEYLGYADVWEEILEYLVEWKKESLKSRLEI